VSVSIVGGKSVLLEVAWRGLPIFRQVGGFVMGHTKPDVALDANQEAEAERLYERLRGAFDDELKRMARLMASKPNRQLFGQTEFELRDRIHELGAQLLEAAADERQKKGRLRGS
jgi:hypothetical protein